MSRLKNFTHSLLSGYAQVAVNVLYTLASVPLALHYLSNAEFGLWALTLQVANFIGLVDLGMGSSIARILIDHKDERSNGRYGGAIKSGFLVCLAQGLITLAVGLSLVWFMAGWLRLPTELARPFFWLMTGQVLLTSAMFSMRMFGQILYAWQRMDVSNYSGMIQLAAGFVTLWIGFHAGFGVYSLLAGSVASWVCGTIIHAVACQRLGHWPRAGEWGRVSREQFRELFHYGTHVFLISIGTQLILSSQTVLVSRQLGVEAAALWSVMTKAFTMVSQMVWRIITNAMPAFAEMQVRGEWGRLWHRYRGLFITVNVMAGVCGVLFAACNGLFVHLLTHGKFSWSAADNILLAVWLVLATQQCSHNSLIIAFKEVRGLKYIFFLEGIVFVAAGLWLLPRFGLTGMLACSVLATLFFTWAIGIWRLARLSGLGWKPFLWDWQLPLLRVLLVLVPCWVAVEWLVSGQSVWLRFIITGGVLALAGGWVSVRLALPADIVSELATKLPSPLRRFLGR